MLNKIENHPELDNIIDAINAQNISISELAKKSGLAYATVSRILHAKQTLSLKAEKKLLAVLRLNNSEEEFEGLYNYKGVSGYIEFNGKICKITSLQSLVAKTKEIKSDINITIKEAKEIKEIDKANKKHLTKSTLTEQDIDLFRQEEYNAEAVQTWSFCKSEDVREDIDNTLGNMSKGFPFIIDGKEWLTSESAYIAGMFSSGGDERLKIQKELQAETNGYTAKKEIRRKYESKFKRFDWEEGWNVQWMLYVVWQKCKTNQQFADILKAVPQGAVIIENSTAQRGETASFWGAKNPELKEKRDIIEHDVEIRNFGKPVKEVNEKKMLERNKINNIGVWKGVNVMGKILKICQLCLLNGTEPNIDYDLLRSKHIYLLGNLLTFD